MTDFQGPRCETCKFGLFESEGDTGVCRRYPAVPLLVHAAPSKANTARSVDGEFDIKLQAFFPPMLRSGWCGEHAPASVFRSTPAVGTWRPSYKGNWGI